MYERFTDRARKVMQLAKQEAQRFNHEYIGTEHILLGLMKEGNGVAANLLTAMHVGLDKIRLEVEKLVQSGPEMVTMSKRPLTPWAKKVIEYSMEEARNLNHNYVGTEHILLGLLREQEGVAAQVLMNLGLKLEEVREKTLYIGGPSEQLSTEASTDAVTTLNALVEELSEHLYYEAGEIGLLPSWDRRPLSTSSPMARWAYRELVVRLAKYRDEWDAIHDYCIH